MQTLCKENKDQQLEDEARKFIREHVLPITNKGGVAFFCITDSEYVKPKLPCDRTVINEAFKLRKEFGLLGRRRDEFGGWECEFKKL